MLRTESDTESKIGQPQAWQRSTFFRCLVGRSCLGKA